MGDARQLVVILKGLAEALKGLEACVAAQRAAAPATRPAAQPPAKKGKSSPKAASSASAIAAASADAPSWAFDPDGQWLFSLLRHCDSAPARRAIKLVVSTAQARVLLARLLIASDGRLAGVLIAS